MHPYSPARMTALDLERTRLRVLVSCADRKRVQVPDRLRLGSLSWRGARQTAKWWIGRLDIPDETTRSAKDLYAGDHWSVAMSLTSLADSLGLDIEVWVASAGYGLIGLLDQVKPYSATFTAGSADSVAPELTGDPRRAALRSWWNELTIWQGPGSGPRSVLSLAGQEPSQPILVALSASYLAATRDDLLQARQRLAVPGLLQIVSAGAQSEDWLTQHLLPAKGRLRHVLGGSLLSLNTRIARWIVATFEVHRFDPSVIRLNLLELDQSVKGRRLQSRRRLTDPEVVAFVRGHLGSRTVSSRSRLLRELRRNGNSCEQTRFWRLFDVALAGK